ncbi:hypothetical protein QOT17_016154 [Balamuthia mandrillaris]
MQKKVIFLTLLSLFVAFAACGSLLNLQPSHDERAYYKRASGRDACDDDPCGETMTCCLMGGQAACCPAANACCCPDQQHCCAGGYKCQCSGSCPGRDCACSGCTTSDEGLCQDSMAFNLDEPHWL